MKQYVDKVKDFAVERPLTVAGIMLALAILAIPTSKEETSSIHVPAATNTYKNAQVGFTSVRKAEQGFGNMEVLSATIDRNPNSTKDFVYVEVEGMPCVMHFPQANRGGISCDWSKWEGKTFEQAIQEQVVPAPVAKLPTFVGEVPTVVPVTKPAKQVNTTVISPYQAGGY